LTGVSGFRLGELARVRIQRGHLHRPPRELTGECPILIVLPEGEIELVRRHIGDRPMVYMIQRDGPDVGRGQSQPHE
jgi:hypothetical protein